ncbi:MAG TPA: DUF2007 domain-containing protein [Phycisphaerae bacterium]|nr:DUF2007 domain-containing protein [Phycisphaerae bacterium]
MEYRSLGTRRIQQRVSVDYNFPMTRVASADNPLHARILVSLLEDEGIKACVQGEALWGARGELPFDTVPTIWVLHDEDVERAVRLIGEKEGKPNPASCSKCGYDLRGLDRARCPECGTPFRVTGEWICPCGEQMGTQFEACWKCRRPQEDAVRVIAAQARSSAASGEGADTLANPACLVCRGAGRVRRRWIPMFLVAYASMAVGAALFEFGFGRFQTLQDKYWNLGKMFLIVIVLLGLAVITRWRKCPCTLRTDSLD